jgi:alpha-acetolactate decarboxylase
MAVLDGTVYQIKADGSVNVMGPETRTPFATICHFTPSISGPLAFDLDHKALLAELDKLAVNPNLADFVFNNSHLT